MWVRSAFWIGHPRNDEQFYQDVIRDIIPGLRRLPGVKAAEALWPRRREDGPPAIWCQILVHFDTLAAVDLMLASPERAAMRAQVREIAATFDGTISHIDYEQS